MQIPDRAPDAIRINGVDAEGVLWFHPRDIEKVKVCFNNLTGAYGPSGSQSEDGGTNG